MNTWERKGEATTLTVLKGIDATRGKRDLIVRTALKNVHTVLFAACCERKKKKRRP
jgi:hypothetical protein